jgi:hypothetical protein
LVSALAGFESAFFELDESELEESEDEESELEEAASLDFLASAVSLSSRARFFEP